MLVGLSIFCTDWYYITAVNRSEPFSTILIPLHSFSRLLTESRVDRAPASIRASLREGGLFSLALHNPQREYLNRDPEALFPLAGPVGETLTIYERSRWNPQEKILHLEWFLEEERGEYDQPVVFGLRIYSPGGFTVTDHYGWYDGTPLREESETQILICRKAL